MNIRHGRFFGIIGVVILLSAGRARGDERSEAEHSNRPSVTVRGEAEVSASPDRAVVELGAERQADTAAAAQNQVSATLKAVLEQVHQVGVPDSAIQTSHLSLTPVYSNPQPGRPDQAEQRIIGYRASNVVRVRLDDIALVGKVIDAGLRGGANQLQGISFTLKDEGPIQAQALDQAVRQARTKAEAIARALGQRLGPVMEVVEEGAQTRSPRPMMMGARFASVNTPVEPGEVQVQGSVALRYELAPLGTSRVSSGAPAR